MNKKIIVGIIGILLVTIIGVLLVKGTKKYTVTFDSFIENYLKVTGVDEKYNSVFFNAINKEIQLRLYNSFKDYSCIKCLESNKYEIQIQETHSLPLNLLKTHIISILNDIISIEEDNISLIEA